MNILQFDDKDGARWYCAEEDKDNQARWCASVTEILSIAVPKRLQSYFQKTSYVDQSEKLGKAAAKGSRIHELIAMDLNGIEPQVTEVDTKPFANWLAMKKEHNIEPIASELRLIHLGYGFGGTADIIGKFDGITSVLDAKTGRYPIKAGWQISAYRSAYEFMTENSCPGMVGLSIPADGKPAKAFVYEHVDFCWTTFLACFSIWRAINYNKLAKVNWEWLNKDFVVPAE